MWLGSEKKKKELYATDQGPAGPKAVPQFAKKKRRKKKKTSYRLVVLGGC